MCGKKSEINFLMSETAEDKIGLGNRKKNVGIIMQTDVKAHINEHTSAPSVRQG